MINLRKKRNNKSKLIIISIGFIILFSLGFMALSGKAMLNGPNYYGREYPGNYSSPLKPDFYKFTTSQSDPGHYGTHDWIADAALRCLRDSSKNPAGYDDWSWLLNSNIANNKYPAWKDTYSDANGNHWVVRSYMTYLYATQMADMKKSEYLTYKIPSPEDVVIGNLKKAETGYGFGTWTDRSRYHHYNFYVQEKDGARIFIPALNDTSRTKSPLVARMLGDQAVKAIARADPDPNDPQNVISKMQPEAAAAWLGAMSHFIADLAVPAHVIGSTNVFDPGDHPSGRNGYHHWYERCLGELTFWGGEGGGDAGPKTNYFDYDVNIPSIIPVRPDLAAISMAFTTIGIAYTYDQDPQYDKTDENSGLYIINRAIMDNWATSVSDTDRKYHWKDDIDSGDPEDPNVGRELSDHTHFYNKIEQLLSSATYWTACAMQWVYDEAQKILGKDPDPDGSVKNAKPDDFFPPEGLTPEEVNALQAFHDLARLLPVILIPIIPMLIRHFKDKR